MITPAGLRVPDAPMTDFMRMPPEAIPDLLYNGRTQDYLDFLPDPHDFDAAIKGYGEATTFVKLAWNPRYDYKLDRRVPNIECPALVIRADEDRLIPDVHAERGPSSCRTRASSTSRARTTPPGTASSCRSPTPLPRSSLASSRRSTDERAGVLRNRLHALPVHPARRRDRVELGRAVERALRPAVRHKAYEHYLEINITAEKLGFDGVLTNEHHQTAYGNMPNPNIAATWVAAHTTDSDRRDGKHPQHARESATRG